MTAHDLTGRTFAITGTTSGIGRSTARLLAARGCNVFLLNRSAEKTRPILAELTALGAGGRYEHIPIDLGDLASVRDAARALLARDLPIHVLINNAGLAGTAGQTAQGFELAFGTNHLGHFLLTKLLLERLRASGPARVVTVASKAHYRARRIDWDAVAAPSTSFVTWPQYSVSKLCNVLFSAELGRRVAGTGVTTYSLHPGVIASDIWRRFTPAVWLGRLILPSNDEGAATTIYCAASPAVAAQTGLYYDSEKVKEPSRLARDTSLAAELWRRSEAWVEPFAS